MAETTVIFETSSGEVLCFNCAVKKVMEADNTEQVNMTSTDYPYHQCKRCEKFIDSKIYI